MELLIVHYERGNREHSAGTGVSWCDHAWIHVKASCSHSSLPSLHPQMKDFEEEFKILREIFGLWTTEYGSTIQYTGNATSWLPPFPHSKPVIPPYSPNSLHIFCQKPKTQSTKRYFTAPLPFESFSLLLFHLPYPSLPIFMSAPTSSPVSYVFFFFCLMYRERFFLNCFITHLQSWVIEII